FCTSDDKITAVITGANPGHRLGFLPNFLADNGTQVIISGGMSSGAVDIFNERGVEVVVGVQSDAQTAVETYLKGELVSSSSICYQHKHAHKCGIHN
ncbi:MAG: NifB/NifX family molybdenum-iron cluster-binding protein, partial [Parabacteroides sp.]|nr:NifB/NifX family molybdenum-iron cluster-binding protein [Parabacteroides sp.]